MHIACLCVHIVCMCVRMHMCTSMREILMLQAQCEKGKVPAHRKEQVN